MKRGGIRVPQTVEAEYLLAPDPVNKRAIDAYLNEFGRPDSVEFVLLIPAFNEHKNLPIVAQLIQNAADTIRVGRVVVLDDGSEDDTKDVARQLGFGVCIATVNRGQGAVLKMGYQLAIELRAEYVIVVDADGQWDPSDLGAILAPLKEGSADFVQGSRSLGETRVGDPVRDFGVTVFARLITVLTGTKVTDTSSGYRAFRTRLLSGIRLSEPQYQSSELLIGAIMTGARIREIATVMHRRPTGTSKKGNNLKYGLNYTRVVLGTWLRERFLVQR